ncbi:MAG: RNA polymerase sigma factor [Beduini sp.]|uniref:RNA polymerase sigma factor n=1 Tax=Beduini sp. TaxID=1922300 RepID=UPI00399FF4B9
MSSKIIKRLIQKEDHTLDSMIRDCYPKIYGYVYRRVMDEALAKDLTQETFYHFFEHFYQYQDQGKLLNYLYRIAQHLLYDYFKSKKVVLSELDESLISDPAYDTQAILKRQEEGIILRKWIEQLPFHLQDIVYLRYYEKMKFKDISKITGIHISTLKSQAKLAVELLEKMAKKEGWK